MSDSLKVVAGIADGWTNEGPAPQREFLAHVLAEAKKSVRAVDPASPVDYACGYAIASAALVPLMDADAAGKAAWMTIAVARATMDMLGDADDTDKGGSR